MKVVKVKSYPELSKKACKILVEEINKKPNLVLGFATGHTPLGLYKCLVGEFKKKNIDFSKVKSFNLDEYYPMKKSDKNSYFYYMNKNLFDKVNINKKNVNFLDGDSKKPVKECTRYEKLIKKIPIDVQILGVGVNGHIGFNEPGSSFNSKTRAVNLTQETIKQNSRFFKTKQNIPKKALTMGVKTILSAKKIILLASGKDKAKAVGCLINGKIDKLCPVSFLKGHKNIVLIGTDEVFNEKTKK